jgi:hypothetical protein
VLGLLELQNLILQLIIGESLLFFIAITIASFFILWVIVSIPVWISAKILRAKQTKFTRAMLVTAVGPIVYGIVLFISTRLLVSLSSSSLLSIARSPLPSLNTMVGIAIAFIAWVYVFKRAFQTGWIRALGISVVAVIIFVITGIIISFIINQFVAHTPFPLSPSPSQPAIIPQMPFQQV